MDSGFPTCDQPAKLTGGTFATGAFASVRVTDSALCVAGFKCFGQGVFANVEFGAPVTGGLKWTVMWQKSSLNGSPKGFIHFLDAYPTNPKAYEIIDFKSTAQCPSPIVASKLPCLNGKPGFVTAPNGISYFQARKLRGHDRAGALGRRLEIDDLVGLRVGGVGVEEVNEALGAAIQARLLPHDGPLQAARNRRAKLDVREDALPETLEAGHAERAVRHSHACEGTGCEGPARQLGRLVTGRKTGVHGTGREEFRIRARGRRIDMNSAQGEEGVLVRAQIEVPSFPLAVNQAW